MSLTNLSERDIQECQVTISEQSLMGHYPLNGGHGFVEWKCVTVPVCPKDRTLECFLRSHAFLDRNPKDLSMFLKERRKKMSIFNL
ncbi:hypothetical protein NPIL_328291 [Nephila pilipes]|uniref:Uncharacterized protein n=1 Tax=Nephila pilipes TaxID=299642 RepID=A0A8X6TNR9_NEPPI|nr:hypothetical protein NPIL_328291 [Nephila pilipes]